MDSGELTATRLNEREVLVLLQGSGTDDLATPNAHQLEDVSFVTVEGGSLSLPDNDGHIYDQCFVANVGNATCTVTVRAGVTVDVAAGKSRLFARGESVWREVA